VKEKKASKSAKKENLLNRYEDT